MNTTSYAGPSSHVDEHQAQVGRGLGWLKKLKSRMLEIVCGDGLTARSILAHQPSDVVVAIDNEPNMIARNGHKATVIGRPDKRIALFRGRSGAAQSRSLFGKERRRPIPSASASRSGS